MGYLFVDGGRALLLRGSEATDLLYLVTDQALHVSLLAVIAAVLSHKWPVFAPALPALATSSQDNWRIVYLICLVFLVWTVPVVEMEAMNTLLAEVEGIPIPSRGRLLRALERIGGMAVMLPEFTFPRRHQEVTPGPVGGATFTFSALPAGGGFGVGYGEEGLGSPIA